MLPTSEKPRIKIFTEILEQPEIKPGTDGLRDDGDVILGHADAFGGAIALLYPDTKIAVVGRDSRLTGSGIVASATDAITRTGVHAVDCGILPTPAVSWLARSISTGDISVDTPCQPNSVSAVGLMATASHNKPGDNGLKAFMPDGGKPDVADTDRLVFFLNHNKTRKAAHEGFQEGQVISDQADRLRGLYEASLIEGLSGDLLAGKKVVIDAGFGAAFQTGPNAFRSLGANVVEVACEARGEEINVAYGATHPDATAKKVLENGADFGIALDGDADRVMLVSKEGKILDGDRMMLILAMAAMQRSQPGEITKVVGTVMSNMGLQFALQEQATRLGKQVEFFQADVGDTAVARLMEQQDAAIGGEQSGHILQGGEAGDGVRSAIQVMNALDELGMDLDEAYALMDDFPQVLLNAEMPDAATRGRIAESDELQTAIAELNADLKQNGIKGRILVRQSGTENLVRVMIELEKGQDELAQNMAESLTDYALDLAWPKDIHNLGELAYGSKNYRITVGRDPKLVGALIQGSREPEMADMVPKDHGKRFKNRASFEDWYARNKYPKHLVALWDGEDLAGIIWHGESPIAHELESLTDKGAELNFLHAIPEGCHDTFAIRLYERSRHQRVASEETSLARKFMGMAQSLYEQARSQTGRSVERIWLETNLFAKNGQINNAVHLYHKAGYRIVGTYDNPDPTNPEVRVMMITNIEADSDLATTLSTLGAFALTNSIA
jgi:phosphoglucosamine mutase